jgi:hypothetical protein
LDPGPFVISFGQESSKDLSKGNQHLLKETEEGQTKNR